MMFFERLVKQLTISHFDITLSKAVRQFMDKPPFVMRDRCDLLNGKMSPKAVRRININQAHEHEVFCDRKIKQATLITIVEGIPCTQLLLMPVSTKPVSTTTNVG